MDIFIFFYIRRLSVSQSFFDTPFCDCWGRDANELRFDSISFFIFLVKLLSVVAQKEKSKYSKEDTPESTPHADMVQKSLKTDSIIEYIGGELKVEGNSIWVISQAINFRHLLRDGINLNILCFFFGPPPKIVL